MAQLEQVHNRRKSLIYAATDTTSTRSRNRGRNGRRDVRNNQMKVQEQQAAATGGAAVGFRHHDEQLDGSSATADAFADADLAANSPS